MRGADGNAARHRGDRTGAARLRITTLLGAAVLLAACGGGEPRMFNLTSDQRGPDEFRILPTRPLEMPASLADLPPPVPGGVNRVDRDPRAEAVAALGGNPAALTAAGAPAADGALLARATRFGVEPGVRDQLAAEDLEFRRRNRGRVLERLFGVTVYYRAYRPFALDRDAELERWRAAGARTPGAPPPDRR
jgi:hypothetical protein